jgi:hypothetical protein
MNVCQFLPLALSGLLILAGCDTASTPEASAVTLAVPEVLHPPDGMANAPTTAVLTWRAVEHAFAYDVEWGWTRETVHTHIGRATGLTHLLSDLTPGTEVFWRVRSIRGTDTGPWTAIHRFTARSAPHPVASPVQTEPPNGIEDMPPWAILEWNPVPGALSYHVIATIDEDMRLYQANLEGIEETRLHLPSLIYTYPYWWKVRALGPEGYGPWSPVWIFTVKDEP